MDWLKGLTLDAWYKLLMAAALAVLVLALTVKLVSVDNVAVQLLALGTFIFGLGEWRNHPLQTAVYPRAVVTGYPRRWTAVGGLLDIIGLAIIGKGLLVLLA